MTEHPATSEQLELLHAASRRRTSSRSPAPTAVREPVAQVLVDTGLAHLDRLFEYVVPQSMDESARPGVRVKVRFAGQDCDGFVVARVAEAEHAGRLSPLRRVVSDEPVLTDEVLCLARAVATRYAGTVSEVLRLAVPPRHARAEKALAMEAPTVPEMTAAPAGSAWSAYAAGPALLRRVRQGEAPSATWLAAPGREQSDDWPRALGELARSALEGGRGALVVVPDARDVRRVATELEQVIGKTRFVTLTADQGPQARYTAWLKVLRGHVRCVLGTRAAAFAPVHELGLVACWDDGDDSLSEPRAPYPHVREVLRLRAEARGAALVLGGFSQSVGTAALAATAGVPTLSSASNERPRVRVAGDEVDQERYGAAARARLPTAAWQAASRALQDGAPVLVQVPRRGYLPSLSCARCRRPARCEHCHGPLALPSSEGTPECRWCGRHAFGHRCPECGDAQLRSAVVGARRTAEELGRAFPGVAVRRSGAEHVLDRVEGEPALVVATPGAEPAAEGGYGAVLLLDAWALLDRPGLDAGAEALRRWMAAAALARAGAEGAVVLCGAPAHVTLPPVEALVRWAPAWFAERELDERRVLRLPPAAWMAQVGGDPLAVDRAAQRLAELTDAEVLGPMPWPGPREGGRSAEKRARLLVRADLEQADRWAEVVRRLRGQHSAHKESGSLQVRVDPDSDLV